MPFTTESAVREKFQLNDTTAAPAALLSRSIDDAHTQILSALDPGTDTELPPAGLIQGETLLAGVLLLRSLASANAADHVVVTIGGQRVERGQRFAALIALSDQTEREAWALLSPYLLGARTEVMLMSATSPVLGDE